MTERMEISGAFLGCGLLISSHGFSSRCMGGVAMGFGEATNWGGEPGLPVRRRESPASECLEVALREGPVRSSLGGGTEGVQE